MDKTKTFFIKTYGCQMNELDSEVVKGILEQMGYEESSNEAADLYIFNTCSVRDLAEQKVIGKIGLIGRKKKKPVIGVIGCMAMAWKEQLFKKFPFIKFILGPNDLNKLPQVLKENDSSIFTSDTCLNDTDYLIAKRSQNIHAYVSIIKGCNNFCSYCIVPYTRGREVSRDADSIINECVLLRDKGFKEITLLGQNVNSYKDQYLDFPDLLYKLNKIKGLERIRFLTSHPKDITEKLIYAIRDLPSICEFIHFPVQSGSNQILKKMNRKYNVEEYLSKINFIKKQIPNATFGTDIIVGFPGETEKDFEKTLLLFQEIQYSQAFIFAYSPRKGTPAFHLEDDVSKEIKLERLQKTLSVFNEISHKNSQQLIGTKIEVLVESVNKEGFLKGRARTFEKVIFKGDSSLVGTLQNVRLMNHSHQTFLGHL